MADRKEKSRNSASKEIHAEIDRIEDGKMAVLVIHDEGKTQLDMPLALLPEGASDGDHLRITVSLDKDSRADAAERVKKLQDRLAQTGGAEGQKDFKL